jgi:hypothetical protein
MSVDLQGRRIRFEELGPYLEMVDKQRKNMEAIQSLKGMNIAKDEDIDRLSLMPLLVIKREIEAILRRNDCGDLVDKNNRELENSTETKSMDEIMAEAVTDRKKTHAEFKAIEQAHNNCIKVNEEVGVVETKEDAAQKKKRKKRKNKKSKNVSKVIQEKESN